MKRARIIGTGQFLPKRRVTNKDMEAFVDTTDEWIRQRTGIAQRYLAEVGEGPSDFGAPAAQRALDAAGIKAQDIDMLLCATVTPDYLFPSTACMIQDKIGARQIPAFDLNAACSGFVYALATADAYIRSGAANTILVVGAEVVSNRLIWEKRDTAVLFGDGAGAVVLRAEEGENGVLHTCLGANGSEGELLILPGGGSKYPITADNVGGIEHGIQMKGRELFKQAVLIFETLVREALAFNGVTLEDLDLFVPHQANVRIIEAAAHRCHLPMEKIFMNIDRVANTTSASIPIALDDAVQQGRIQPGSLILLGAFGAGLTWGSALIRW